MNSSWQRLSSRAIMAVVAAIVMLIIEVQPRARVRVRLETVNETAAWMLAVVALTFGMSSVCKRESAAPLALVASFVAIIELLSVLELVSKYLKME